MPARKTVETASARWMRKALEAPQDSFDAHRLLNLWRPMTSSAPDRQRVTWVRSQFLL
jgi:hypothetical protein